MAENLQHEDFGEKIGGAKKDLWKDRGLYVDDLGAMNEREAEKFVKKDNVWKKPDYQAMLDDGVPLGVVYFIKKARDSLGASPQYRYSDKTPELRRARQEEYIETVRQLQAVIEDVRTLDDAMQAYISIRLPMCVSMENWNNTVLPIRQISPVRRQSNRPLPITTGITASERRQYIRFWNNSVMTGCFMCLRARSGKRIGMGVFPAITKPGRKPFRSISAREV